MTGRRALDQWRVSFATDIRFDACFAHSHQSMSYRSDVGGFSMQPEFEQSRTSGLDLGPWALGPGQAQWGLVVLQANTGQ